MVAATHTELLAEGMRWNMDHSWQVPPAASASGHKAADWKVRMTPEICM